MSSEPKGKKVTIALTVVFFILSAALFFIAFGVTEMGKIVYDESNTKEYTATYRRMEEGDSKKGYLVYFDEYDCGFHLLKTTIVSDEALKKLESGANVTFRIYSHFENLIGNSEADYIPFVTLKVEETEIATFESSNLDESKKTTNVKIGGCVFAGAFLAGAIACAAVLGTKMRRKTGNAEN